MKKALIDTDPERVPPLALPPLPEGVLAGTLSGDALAKVGREGARTVPARENGGNHDIKNFTRGSRVFYPVHVPGALFSGGDLHFSQGDGEITFCGAIEMGGFIDFGVDLIKDGMNKYGVTTNPIFIPGRVEPRYSEFLTFIGISVDEGGENHYLDATIAYRRACLNAIAYLKTRKDVDPNRIGGIGLSVGGELMLEAAAETDDLAAVVSEGAGARTRAEELDTEGLPKLDRWLGHLTYSLRDATVAILTGHKPPRHLKTLVGKIAPRPLLLIAAPNSPNGEKLNRIYYQAAREPKALWEIPHAGPVNGIATHSAEYERRVVAFFDRALAP